MWDNKIEQNSIEAMQRSFLNGFDAETDLRIVNGEFIISHDLPKKNHDLLKLTQHLAFSRIFPTEK